MRIAFTSIMIGLLAAGCRTHEQAYSIIYIPGQSAAHGYSSAFSTNGHANAVGHLYSEAPAASLTPVSSNSASRIYSEPAGQTPPAQGVFLNEDNPWNAQDEGLTEADRAIVRRIRQSMRQDYSLSSDAPILKITVNNGQVVLGGTVTNEVEKRRLETLSQKIDGVTSVQDQLAVKPD